MGDSISEGVVETFVKGKYSLNCENMTRFSKDSVIRQKLTFFIKYLPLFLNILGPGEFVEADECIARIETDKVTVDICSPVAGVIQKYFAGEGDTIEVGANFFEIDEDAKAGAAPEAPKAAVPTPQVSKSQRMRPQY